MPDRLPFIGREARQRVIAAVAGEEITSVGNAKLECPVHGIITLDGGRVRCYCSHISVFRVAVFDTFRDLAPGRYPSISPRNLRLPHGGRFLFSNKGITRQPPSVKGPGRLIVRDHQTSRASCCGSRTPTCSHS